MIDLELLDDIIDELLTWLEFYHPHGEEFSGYYVRPYKISNYARFIKLQELYSCYAKLFFFVFMRYSESETESVFYIEDLEIDYIGTTGKSAEDFFLLGRCWGEYTSLYCQTNETTLASDDLLIDDQPTGELLARYNLLLTQRKEGQRHGAKRNAEIGSHSKKTCKDFIEKNFPNGLEGRKKNHVYAECLYQVESYVKLQNKVTKGIVLSEQDQIEFENVLYLQPLTKNSMGSLTAYKYNSLKTIMSPMLSDLK